MVLDFSVEERSFLSDPLAEEACKRAGVLLETLRPSANVGDPVRLERRRQYNWSLVRAEHLILQRLAADTELKGALADSTVGKEARTDADAMSRAHDASIRNLVAQQSLALQRDFECETKKYQLELRQERAREVREAHARERERTQRQTGSRRELVAEMQEARRVVAAEKDAEKDAEKEAKSSGGQAGESSRERAGKRPSSAPPGRPVVPVSSEASSRARERRELADLARESLLEERRCAQAQALAGRQSELAYERERKQVQSEQARLRHQERLLAVESADLERTIELERARKRREERATELTNARLQHTARGHTPRPATPAEPAGGGGDGAAATTASGAGAPEHKGRAAVESGEELRRAQVAEAYEAAEAKREAEARRNEERRRRVQEERRARQLLLAVKREAALRSNQLQQESKAAELSQRLSAADEAGQQARERGP